MEKKYIAVLAILISIIIVGILVQLYLEAQKRGYENFLDSLPGEQPLSASAIQSKLCLYAIMAYKCEHNIYKTAPPGPGPGPSYWDSQGDLIEMCGGPSAEYVDPQYIDPWPCEFLTKLECETRNLCEK